MKTKEQLEQEINELNELLTQSVATKDNISTQLSAAQQELARSKYAYYDQSYQKYH